MKKLLLINVLFMVLASCKNNSNPARLLNPNMVLVDTTGLYKSNALTDIAYAIIDPRIRIEDVCRPSHCSGLQRRIPY